MKTTTTLLAALFLTFSTAFANGNEEKKASQIALYKVAEHQYRLIYPYPEKETVEIQVQNAKGQVITSDKVYNEIGFLRKYDMNKLSSGQYNMIIKGASGTFEKVFTIQSKKQLAVYPMQDKKVKLVYADKEKTGTLKIYNNRMELIHRETYKENGGFSRVYDLSAFDCEQFTFQFGNESVALAVNN
jgi:hypothetical protein